jgi:hypothetical protein
MPPKQKKYEDLKSYVGEAGALSNFDIERLNPKPKSKSTVDKLIGMFDIFGIADKAKKQVEQRKQDSISPAKKKANKNFIAQTREEKERAKAMHEARLKEGPYPSTPASSDKASMIKNITKKAKRFKEQRSSN